MSQIKPNALIESMSGKICGHSDMYFFRKNGKVFSGKICYPSTKEPTSAQTAQRTKFATAHANTQAALADATQRANYEAFLKAFERLPDQLPEFTLKTWHGLVDYVTVYAEDDIRFTFKNGQEVKA